MHEQQTAARGGRREALKARHRRAIIDAASELMDELEGTHFTVDQLAERADVSRRTVFNHFGSLDEVVLEVLGRVLETIVDSIDAGLAADPAERAAEVPLFDRVAAALRNTDLVTPIVRLTRSLGEPGGAGASAHGEAVLFERAFTDLSARTAAVARRHHPEADPFTVDLMCSSLVSGGLVVVRYWEEATGGVDSAESRRVWDGLLERMISATRAGYGAHRPDAGTS